MIKNPWDGKYLVLLIQVFDVAQIHSHWIHTYMNLYIYNSAWFILFRTHKIWMLRVDPNIQILEYKIVFHTVPHLITNYVWKRQGYSMYVNYSNNYAFWYQVINGIIHLNIFYS